MIGFLTSEAGLSLVGLVVGYFFRYNAERNKAINDRIAQRDASMDAASKRDGGTWMRRAIYFFIVAVFMAALLAPYLGEHTVVENVVSKGMLFWKRTVTEFVSIDGVLLPADIRKAFLMLCAYYMGQGTR